MSDYLLAHILPFVVFFLVLLNVITLIAWRHSAWLIRRRRVFHDKVEEMLRVSEREEKR